VKATSVLNPERYDTATVTVTIPTGIISVRITGIPLTVMQSAANYDGFAYGLYRGNEFDPEDIYENVLAHWDSDDGSDAASTDYTGAQTSGTFYYEFTFLDAGSDDEYAGTARGYDIGIMDHFSGATWVLKNRQLNIDTVNTIAYSAFTPVVGTFRIKITGIPADIMAAGAQGQNDIGLYAANELAASSFSMSDSLESLGGRTPGTYSGDPPYADVTNYTGQPSGTFDYEFTIWNNSEGKPYVDKAGNYDIGFIRFFNYPPASPGDVDVRAVSNHSLAVNTVTTIAYSSFVQKTITGGTGGGGDSGGGTTYTLHASGLTTSEWNSYVKTQFGVNDIAAFNAKNFTLAEFNSIFAQLAADDAATHLIGRPEAEIRAAGAAHPHLTTTGITTMMNKVNQQGWVLYAVTAADGTDYADIIGIKKD